MWVATCDGVTRMGRNGWNNRMQLARECSLADDVFGATGGSPFCTVNLVQMINASPVQSRGGCLHRDREGTLLNKECIREQYLE